MKEKSRFNNDPSINENMMEETGDREFSMLGREFGDLMDIKGSYWSINNNDNTSDKDIPPTNIKDEEKRGDEKDNNNVNDKGEVLKLISDIEVRMNNYINNYLSGNAFKSFDAKTRREKLMVAVASIESNLSLHAINKPRGNFTGAWGVIQLVGATRRYYAGENPLKILDAPMSWIRKMVRDYFKSIPEDAKFVEIYLHCLGALYAQKAKKGNYADDVIFEEANSMASTLNPTICNAKGQLALLPFVKEIDKITKRRVTQAGGNRDWTADGYEVTYTKNNKSITVKGAKRDINVAGQHFTSDNFGELGELGQTHIDGQFADMYRAAVLTKLLNEKGVKQDNVKNDIIDDKKNEDNIIPPDKPIEEDTIKKDDVCPLITALVPVATFNLVKSLNNVMLNDALLATKTDNDIVYFKSVNAPSLYIGIDTLGLTGGSARIDKICNSIGAINNNYTNIFVNMIKLGARYYHLIGIAMSPRIDTTIELIEVVPPKPDLLEIGSNVVKEYLNSIAGTMSVEGAIIAAAITSRLTMIDKITSLVRNHQLSDAALLKLNEQANADLQEQMRLACIANNKGAVIQTGELIITHGSTITGKGNWVTHGILTFAGLGVASLYYLMRSIDDMRINREKLPGIAAKMLPLYIWFFTKAGHTSMSKTLLGKVGTMNPTKHYISLVIMMRSLINSIGSNPTHEFSKVVPYHCFNWDKGKGVINAPPLYNIQLTSALRAKPIGGFMAANYTMMINDNVMPGFLVTTYNAAQDSMPAGKVADMISYCHMAMIVHPLNKSTFVVTKGYDNIISHEARKAVSGLFALSVSNNVLMSALMYAITAVRSVITKPIHDDQSIKAVINQTLMLMTFSYLSPILARIKDVQY